MIRSDASLRGKVKALAKKDGLRPQEVLQMYYFEHFLLRLEKSPYAHSFVLKGGMLIASIVGIAQRTTMDMDATVTGLPMSRELTSLTPLGFLLMKRWMRFTNWRRWLDWIHSAMAVVA